jgi:hypothetical protein
MKVLRKGKEKTASYTEGDFVIRMGIVFTV